MAPSVKERGNFTVHLDIGIVDNSGGRARTIFVNVTSRLVAVIERGFHNGDTIKCFGSNSTQFSVMKSLTLNYSRAIGR